MPIVRIIPTATSGLRPARKLRVMDRIMTLAGKDRTLKISTAPKISPLARWAKPSTKATTMKMANCL